MNVTPPGEHRAASGEWSARVGEAAAVASAHAVESELQRRLAAPVVEALRSNGLLTLTLPAAYGGPAIELPDLVDVLTSLGHGDGAAGWCAMIGNATTSMAAFTDPEAVRAIFADPTVATAGVFAPNGVAARTADGWSVDGRWSWGSGTQHSEWVTGGVFCDDGGIRVCWFPVAAVEFHDTWHTVGLRGTGSLDFSVSSARVAPPFAIEPTWSPLVDESLARFPSFTLLAVGVAAVALGIARRALDELIAIASGKVPQFSSRTLADNPFAQIELARAEARWGAAHAFVAASVSQAWENAASGCPVTVAERVRIRLAAGHAASECVAVADTAWTLAGGTAVSDSGTVGRCMRDAHMVTQHIMVAPKLMAKLGKFYSGSEFVDMMI